jgi:hypothetical protein
MEDFHELNAGWPFTIYVEFCYSLKLNGMMLADDNICCTTVRQYSNHPNQWELPHLFNPKTKKFRPHLSGKQNNSHVKISFPFSFKIHTKLVLNNKALSIHLWK